MFATKKIILKLSGEFLSGKNPIDLDKAKQAAQQIMYLQAAGFKLAVVIGAGNIFRGRNISSSSFDKSRADYIGMLASLANGLALQVALEGLGAKTEIQSPLGVKNVISKYDSKQARAAFSRQKIFILSGGTGRPSFSTDTAAVSLARDLGAEAVLKGTKVQGVFESDPDLNKSAKKIDKISSREAARRNLKIMDETALNLAARHKILIYVFKWQVGAVQNITKNKFDGSVVYF